ncbi:histidine phosphatase family protein [Limosilactobacillus kribbianus]|uniref:histidine phosphatase family protein n=1 Tax=Limosilactobacillus kribbianus TaxID=2982695 RepID=UPI0022651671|nr:histidine phosphatase family protein [Limosilactobacillus kribbianus]
MATTVYFVRHGETYFNRFARLQGWSDTPLTKKGEEDAAKIGRVLAPLEIDYLFSSDLKRAVDTARILIKQCPNTQIGAPIQKKIFRETFYGSFEGHSNEEGAIWASYLGGQRFRRIGDLVTEFGAAKTRDLLREADPAHLAEGSQQLNARVKEIVAFLQGLPDQSTVVVASHGSIIQYIASVYGAPGEQFESLRNGAFMEMRVTAEGAQVLAYNQQSL